MASIMPVTNLIVEWLRTLWLQLQIADTRWALHEIDPLHPDRHYLEGRLARLKNKKQC